MRRGPTVALLLAAMSSLPAAAGELKYGWTAGMRSHVTINFRVTEIEEGSAPFLQSDITLRYDFETRAEGPKLRVSYSKPVISTAACRADSARVTLFNLLPVDTVVDASGGFNDVRDAERFQSQLNALPAFACRPAQIPREALVDRAGFAWFGLVGGWTDTRYVAGASDETDDHTRFPLDQSLRVPRHNTTTFSESFPCVRARVLAECVAMDRQSTISAADMQNAVRRYLQKNPQREASALAASYSSRLDVKVRLVTEPATLIPHDVQYTVIRTFPPNAEHSRRLRHEETWTATYTYP